MKKIILLGICILILSGCSEDYANYEPGTYDLLVPESTIKETYENNILDGNKEYFGKRIMTYSTYESISDGMFSGLILYMNNVYCTSFNTKEDEEKLSRLNEGQSIMVIGTADEWVSSKLELEDCEIMIY